jgi:hypothetical protein
MGTAATGAQGKGGKFWFADATSAWLRIGLWSAAVGRRFDGALYVLQMRRVA